MSDEVQAVNRAREQRAQDQHMIDFNYDAPAELFPSRIKKRKGAFSYRRFDKAAEAIRFIVEDMPAPAMLGACLEVNEVRFAIADVHALYESAAYPLKRPSADS